MTLAKSETALMTPPDDTIPSAGPEQRRPRLLLLVGAGLFGSIVLGLFWWARAHTNHVPLTSAPKPVTVVLAEGTTFRAVRSYVGTTAPLTQASVGPQYVSAYVGTVLVRPGAVVHRGEVLATLDCRNASAASRDIAARARALDDRRAAAQHEAERMDTMKQGGFASENEVEQLGAKSAADQADVESLRAQLSSRTLEVDDCILRAPFTGEVAERLADPGAYARPGSAVVTVIDRATVRVVADAPETDFSVVAPGKPVTIEIAASDSQLRAQVSRRSPAADETTRTVHFEIDVANPDNKLPANATARVTIEVGKTQNATKIPLRAATVRGDSASLFVIENGRAKRLTSPIWGERGGALSVVATIPARTPVVIEGRALLDDNDAVTAAVAAP